MRKQKLERDKEHKARVVVAQGQGNFAMSPQPEFTYRTKAMLGVMDDVKQKVSGLGICLSGIWYVSGTVSSYSCYNATPSAFELGRFFRPFGHNP